MKLHLLSWSLAATLLSAVPAMAEKPETELGKQMEAMNDAFKALRKESDPVKGATLAREAQNSLVKSLGEVPAVIAKLPEAEKPKALANYRTMIGKAFVIFSEIEEAFVAKDLEKVKDLAEHARGAKKEGHDKYVEEE